MRCQLFILLIEEWKGSIVSPQSTRRIEEQRETYPDVLSRAGMFLLLVRTPR